MPNLDHNSHQTLWILLCKNLFDIGYLNGYQPGFEINEEENVFVLYWETLDRDFMLNYYYSGDSFSVTRKRPMNNGTLIKELWICPLDGTVPTVFELDPR
jgi:hypothetical protein